MAELDDLLQEAQDDLAAHVQQEGDPAEYRAQGGSWKDTSDLVFSLVLARETERRFRVSIEDTGPVLEAIALHMLGEENWESFDAGMKAKFKQNLLDDILPGLTVFVAQVNAQLEAR